MPRPIAAHIHHSALRHNLQRLRCAAPEQRLWAVVKANAYGHGIERVFEPLCAADGFAVLDPDEAQRLRHLGWRGPILLIEGVFEPRDLELCSRLDLWHVIHCEQQIDWLAAHKTPTAQRVFLKLNSGMNRLGFAPAAFASAWARLQALVQVDDIALLTHLAHADAQQQASAAQLNTFERAAHSLSSQRSISNSAAILRQILQKYAQNTTSTANESHLAHAEDWVRAGIALYGASPDAPTHSAQDWDLRPAMSLRSRLIAVQQLQVGDAVGYGGGFIAPEPMCVGIVACGYADGYPRSVAVDGGANAAPVLVGGHMSRVLGRVSMDMLCVDLRPTPWASGQDALGLAVTLWGQHTPERPAECAATLAVDAVAHAAGTIGYELLCATAPRVPFVVHAAD